MTMAEHKPSAAQALYGHLKSGAREPIERRQGGSLAEVMYPRPEPPPKNPYLSPMSEAEWRDQLWALAGLRKKR
jgi:hypothetical protein